MPRGRGPLLVLTGLALLLAPFGACMVQQVRVQPVERNADSVLVATPVKAHLLDGSTIVYRNGVLLARDTLRGSGVRHPLTGGTTETVLRVPLDSVAAMESFSPDVDRVTSTVGTLGGVALGVLGGMALAVAIFGSCPTIYADSAGHLALEAEAFSYSIAPLFERRDVDPLRATARADGTVELEIRNEALETHYINHLELLDVVHGRDEIVVPDGGYHVVALGGIVSPARVRDRAGRDLAALGRTTPALGDAAAFRTHERTLGSATVGDLEDWIDVTVPAPRGTDSAAVLLDLRNSLLNTVLLYETMLGSAGAHALDWVGRDLATIGPAVELGRWYGARMGMRISVWRNGAYERVASIPDAGPIAWRRVAAVVPVPGGEDSLRIRLSFVADQWRIRGVRVASRVRRVEPAVRPIAVLLDATGTADSSARRAVLHADERYLRTDPGQRVTARFVVPPVAADSARTLLLASQGYYIEWIRGDWIRRARSAEPFVPSDAALVATMRRWREVQHDFERRFEHTRIPVR